MASLVYHSGALGDFITTLPAIRLWKRAHPDGPLVLLGRPEHGTLASDLFDETWDAAGSRFAALYSEEPGAAAVAGCLPGIVSALVFAAASSPLWSAVSRLGFTEAVRQDPFPSSGIHVVDYHLGLFGGAVRDEDRVPRIAVAGPSMGPPPGDATAARAPTGLVAVHHGSGSARKNWPRGRFEALAEALRERGYPVAWVRGLADDERDFAGATEQWTSLTLPELASRLARVRLYVGNDSGVSHLAAAVGCPTVALFGPTDPFVWAPRGPRVNVIRPASGRIDDISLDDVLAAAWSFLGESR